MDRFPAFWIGLSLLFGIATAGQLDAQSAAKPMVTVSIGVVEKAPHSGPSLLMRPSIMSIVGQPFRSDVSKRETFRRSDTEVLVGMTWNGTTKPLTDGKYQLTMQIERGAMTVEDSKTGDQAHAAQVFTIEGEFTPGEIKRFDLGAHRWCEVRFDDQVTFSNADVKKFQDRIRDQAGL